MSTTLDGIFDNLIDNIEDLRAAVSNGSNASSSQISSNQGRSFMSNLSQDRFDRLIEQEKKRHEEVMKNLEREYEYNESSHYKQLKMDKELLNEYLEKQEEIRKELKKGTLGLDEQVQKQRELNVLEEKSFQLRNKISKTNTATAVGEDLKKISSSINSAVSGIKGAVTGIWRGVKDFTKPWADADHAASKYAKTVGMTNAAMNQLRKNTIDNVANGIAGKFNMSTQEMLDAQINFVKGTGRNVMVGKEDQIDIAAMSTFQNANDIAAMYDNFGLSVQDSAKHVGKMYSDVTKTGLSWEKYSSNLVKNVKLAQNYTFKNGLKGLESMAKKATEMKLDMQQVANFADKVGTIEGAIETSAKLQVLGGPFASMADPMGMLNESLTNMEGLQDRMIGLIKSMGHFNKTTGQVEISGFNRVRLKEAANAMGVDYNNLMESVHASARREEIGRQINASANASALNKDLRDLIKNQGVIKDGKAGIYDSNGEFKSVDNISSSDEAYLIKTTRTDSDNIRDIAITLRSLVDIEKGIEKGVEAQQAQFLEKTGVGQDVKDILAGLTTSNGFLKTIAGVSMALSIVGGISSILNIAGNLTGGIGKIFKGKGGTKTPKVKGGAKTPKTVYDPKAKRWRIAKGQKGAGQFVKAPKPASSSVLKGGKGLLKSIKPASVATGLGLGIIGGIGNHFTDKAVEEGKMKKGGAGHYAAKMASQAASFAAIGSLLGPIGTAVGAGVGAIVGATQATKAKREDIVDKQLEAKGLVRNGKYGARGLKLIDRALQTGEINERMRKKLISQGDIALLDEINRVKAEKEAKEASLKGETGGEKEFEIKSANFGIEKATISIKNASFGAEIPSIKPINEVGIRSSWEGIKEPQQRIGNNNEPSQSIPKTFDININGTLKLTSDNGHSIDIIKELRQNDSLLRSLSEMISKEIEKINGGGASLQVRRPGR